MAAVNPFLEVLQVCGDHDDFPLVKPNSGLGCQGIFGMGGTSNVVVLVIIVLLLVLDGDVRIQFLELGDIVGKVRVDQVDAAGKDL